MKNNIFENEKMFIRTQRETYWYMKGYEEAFEDMNSHMKIQMLKNDMEYTDHLPRE